jgi:hypothetical protein
LKGRASFLAINAGRVARLAPKVEHTLRACLDCRLRNLHTQNVAQNLGDVTTAPEFAGNCGLQTVYESHDEEHDQHEDEYTYEAHLKLFLYSSVEAARGDLTVCAS